MEKENSDWKELEIIWNNTITTLSKIHESYNSNNKVSFSELEKCIDKVFSLVCESLDGDKSLALKQFEEVLRLRIYENIFEWNYIYKISDNEFKILQLRLYEKILSLYPDFCFSEPRLVYPLIATIQHTCSFKNMLIETQLLKTLQVLVSRITKIEKFHSPPEHFTSKRKSLLYKLAIKSKRRNSESDDLGDEDSNLSIFLASNEDRFDIMQLDLLSDISDEHEIPEDLYYDSALDILIQFISSNSELGWSSRDTILFFLSASNKNEEIAKDIANHTDLITIIIQYLGAAYKQLDKIPSKFLAREASDINWFEYIDWRENLLKDTPTNLSSFFNIWNFVISILQVSHPIIRSKMLHFIHHHFLRIFIGSSITSISKKEKLSGISYLDVIIVQSESSESLLRLILAFLTTERIDRGSEYLINDSESGFSNNTAFPDFDNNGLQEEAECANRSREIGTEAWIKKLMNRLNNYLRNQKNTYLMSLIDELGSVNSNIGLSSLVLFDRIISLNSEDIMYILIFQYLSLNFNRNIHGENGERTKSLLEAEGLEFKNLIPSVSLTRKPDMLQKKLISNDYENNCHLGLSEAYEWLTYLTSASRLIESTFEACKCWKFTYNHNGAPTTKQMNTKNIHQTCVKSPLNLIKKEKYKMMREQDALPNNNLDQQEEDSYMSPYDVDRFTAYLKDQVSNHSMNPLYEVFDKSSTNKDYIDFYDHYFDQIQKCINVRQMNEAMRTEMSSLQGESGTSSSRNPSKSSSKQKSSPEKSQEVRVVLDSLYETSDNGENQLGDPIKSMASLGISEMVMKELKMSRGLNNHKTEKSSDLNKTRILTMSEYEFMKCTGPFLANILTALSNFLTNCFEANLLITSILSKLAASSSSILRNFILLQIDQHPIHVEQKKDPLLNPKWIDNEKSVYLTYSHLLVKYRLNKINNSIESFLMNYASLSLNPYHSNQINSSLEKCNRIFQTPLVNYINLTREKLSELHSEPAQSEERKIEEDGTKNFQLKSIMKHFFGAYNSTSNNGRRYHKGNIKNWLSMQLNLNDVNSNFFRDKILSVIVFEEFCKELSALCVEHSYRI